MVAGVAGRASGYGWVVIILVRHGETQANRAGAYLGREYPTLTESGRRQAERVAAMLPPPDRVITSPLQRAQETASFIDGRAEIDARWIELDYGPLDLTPVGALPEMTMHRWRDDPDFAPEGVETFRTLAARVHSACEELCPLAESSVVVIVTHVSPVKAAVCWALGGELSLGGRMFVDDGGIARIDVADGRPTLRWFNRVGDQPGERAEEARGRAAPGG